MKILTIIFCLFLSLHSSAQDHATQFPDKPLIVVNDTTIYKGDLNRLIKENYGNVMLIDTIKDTLVARTLYGVAGWKGVINVVTKVYATERYQKKFSDFSKKYKNYITGSKGNDKYCFYIVNGDGVQGTENDRIRTLFDIANKKLKSVDIMKNPHINGNTNNKEMVVITTEVR